MVSKHYKNKRHSRERIINRYINGDGRMIDGFVVDRNHKDGLEVHSITENGIILIHNLSSGVLVSKLVARPEQIKRYYDMTGRPKPLEYENILQLAKWHKSLNYHLR